ncbi:ATP-binding cassette domain-containing protein [Candidatus Bipolaricaulota bacterium]|nr:ATP-binding cassette domain-containing protein [Candidatus Bipolaricaulota bacterium]
MAKIVQIAELSVYGDDDEILLEDLSFTLDRGEVAFIRNLSDIQYETLFDVLVGNLSPDSGQVVLDDRNIVRLSRKNRKQMLGSEVSFLPRNFVLPEEKTISESLEFKLKITDSRHNIQERLNEVLELTGLKAKARQLPREMSDGERVKAALAISIVTRPELLICHKPFPGLNSKGIKEVINLLTRISEKQNMSVLLLTDRIDDNINGVNVIESNLDSRVVS